MVTQPIVAEMLDGLWQFIFPEDIESEYVQDRYWQAIELLDVDPKKSAEILSELATRFPYFVDAHNHLSIAYKNLNLRDKSFKTAIEGYQIGRAAFPPEFDHDRDMLKWSILENRQYLRSCHILGLEYQDKNGYDQAIDLYHDILVKNPGDNQGVRYLVFECYLHKRNLEKGREFLEMHYDTSIEFTYGRVLIDVLTNNKDLALDNINEAIASNKYLPQIVIESGRNKPMPYRIPGEPNFIPEGVPVGSVHEAYEYWNRNKEILSSQIVRDFFKKI